ncbi:MAG: helix-turn-helix transcriptional regulator [Burkholderiales bacterium]
MRYKKPGSSGGLAARLCAARNARGFSQAALAGLSGAGRVTIARLEAGADQDFRLGTLTRICDALGMELTAVPRGAHGVQEKLLARERERARRFDARRRHAALAARLLAMPAPEAAVTIRRARAAVDRWERERLCSGHYITRWRAKLAGPVRRVAAALVEHDDWTDALFQSTPWSFALERPAP